MILIVLLGTTSSGKTGLSLELFKYLKAPIISVDSRQIYKYLDIGTDKVGERIRKEIPHYMIDVLYPNETMTVKDYVERVRGLLKDLSSAYRYAILVGGTNLYLKALLEGYVIPPRDLDVRRALQEELKAYGREQLEAELRERDPKAYEVWKKNRDTRRLIRYLEVCRVRGRISDLWERREPITDHEVLKYGISKPRKVIYRDIDHRVDLQVSEGLIDEVAWIVSRYGYDIPALKTLGYQEIVSAFQGERSLMKAIEDIKRNTRRYAKRQLTWLRKEEGVKWFHTSLSKYDPRVKAFYREVASAITADIRKREGHVQPA